MKKQFVKIDGIYYNLLKDDNTAIVTSKPDRYSGSVIIPEKIEYKGMEYSVSSIGESAFNNCHGLTSVTIPTSVTNIEEESFSYCIGLTSIKIPDSVKIIGESAFYGCI